MIPCEKFVRHMNAPSGSGRPLPNSIVRGRFMPRGIIHLLLPRKGQGYIDGPTGEILFDWSALQGIDRGELTAGLHVEYDAVPGPAGPRAVRVRPAEVIRHDPPHAEGAHGPRSPHFLRLQRSRQT